MYEDLARRNPVDVAIKMTLLMVLLYPGDQWFHHIYMRMLAVCGVIFPRLSRSACYWILLFVLNLAVQNLYNWDISDNHMWLYSYWYLAIASSLAARTPSRTLAEAARLLIGLTFFFATLRKAVTDAYLNTDAFRFLLLTDSRFFEVAKLLGGHTQTPQAIWEPMLELQPTVPLQTTAQLDAVAFVLTWWTLVFEGLIALTFLVSQSIWVSRLRNLFLLLFVATTYPVAPVLGFAWVLLILGCAQCPRAAVRTRLAYLIVFAAVYAFHGERIKVEALKWLYGKEFFAPPG